jgi:hypothetical protein
MWNEAEDPFQESLAQRTLYLSDFRQSKLSLLAGFELINLGYNLRFSQKDMTLIPKRSGPPKSHPWLERSDIEKP